MKFFTKKRIIKIIMLTLTLWVIFNFGFYSMNYVNPALCGEGGYTSDYYFLGVKVRDGTFGNSREDNVILLCASDAKIHQIPFPASGIEITDSFLLNSILNFIFYFIISSFAFFIYYKIKLDKKDSSLREKAINTIPLVIIVFLFLIVLGGAYYLMLNNSKNDETNNWKIFRSEKYNFEFKYPTNWECKEYNDSSALHCGPREYDFLYLDILDNPEKLTSKQWVERNVKKVTYEELKKREKNRGEPGVVMYSDEKELMIAGLPAYELDGVFAFDKSLEEVFLAREDKVYFFYFPIAAENPNYPNSIENNKTAHKILSTFRFID